MDGQQKTGTFWEHVPLMYTSIYGVIFWPFFKPVKIGKKIAHFGTRSPLESVVFWCHFLSFVKSRFYSLYPSFLFFFSFLFFPFFFPFFSPFFSPTYARARAVHRNPLAPLGGI